ncbi:MAG: argininosuccinate lyase [Candidatus Promineifilaceae bacterium]
MGKLWGGRFEAGLDRLAERYNASLGFDVRLYEEDIKGSIAWARAIGAAGVLSSDEVATLVAGLEQVQAEMRKAFEAGTMTLETADEDIHSLVERRLIEIVGPVGGKLHTGRSRNDQVATDFRLWVMGAIDRIVAHIQGLQGALLESAKANLNLPMPGYTHLQHAQPVTWGHWVLSHFWPLARDVKRFETARSGAAVLPLGSGALAGTPFPVDRQALAAELGFEAISQNSLDGVSDRDFAADFLYAAAMTAIHLSRLSEQLVLFSSNEFGFVRLADAYSTGSSLMPQKKNPDTLELTRGKSGRLLGHLTGLLATLKGLPSSYDKDLQEDKEPVFDSADTLELALPVMAGVISTLTLRPERMAAQLEPGLLATELADYLVKRGVPFRQAHELVGEVVRLAEVKVVEINELGTADLQTISPHFGEDVLGVFDITAALSARKVVGGTAPEALAEQVKAAEKAMK